MEPDPIIVQLALAIPVILGLIAYTLYRWEKAPLHLLLAALLGSVGTWLFGMLVRVAGTTDAVRLLGLHIEYTAIILMTPLFLISMGYFARSPLFEQSLAPAVGLFSVSAMFYVGFLTDPHHHLFFADRHAALAGGDPAQWAGSIFWAYQFWTLAIDLAGFSYCGTVLVRGPTRAERGRAAMIFVAVLAPALAHFIYVLDLLPLGYTLTPGTLAVTGAFFVQGVHRYGLLGGQTIVRHDLIEHLGDGLVLANESGIVVDANAAAEAVLGTQRSELRGNRLLDVLEQLDSSDKARDLGRRIESLPLDGGPLEAELTAEDGRLIHLSGGAVPALGSQPGGRFVSLQDRTVQRRNEKLLRERQKLESVGILAAGVAHEVNNPLAYVRANLTHMETAAAKLVKREEARDLDDLIEMPELLAESIEGLDRIARIVEGMLRFSRVPDEHHRLVDMDDVVDQAIRLAALQRGANVTAKRGEIRPTVMGSSERLVQVLLNLFLNAKHAAGEGGEIRIEAEISCDGNEVLLEVRDDGPGIPEELQERIFDPFFTTRSPGEGTGLGLSIAFDIIREHNGTLELASQLGEGTCFSIRLPAAPDAL